MCTHTRTCTSTGTVHRVRGLRVRPFSIALPCTDVGSRTPSSKRPLVGASYNAEAILKKVVMSCRVGINNNNGHHGSKRRELAQHFFAE